jgi:hypothetical protein
MSAKHVELVGSVRLEQAREVAQPVDEELEVDLDPLAAVLPVCPGASVTDVVDLVLEPQPAKSEALAKLQEGRHGRGVGKCLTGCLLPQRKHGEGDLADGASLAAAVDLERPQVEQHPVVELALIDVLAYLRLVRSELLRRALGIQYEPVRHQVVRREVGLQEPPAALGKVGVAGEAQDLLQQVPQHLLGEHLLVLSVAFPAEVLAQVACTVQLAVAAAVGVEQAP